MPGSVTKNVFIALYQAQKDDSHREQCMFDNCYDIQIIILERREKTGVGRKKCISETCNLKHNTEIRQKFRIGGKTVLN